MEWSYETFIWLLVMVIIPGVAFLANVIIRSSQDIPLSSGSDLILLLIIYAACVIADPTMLKGLVSPELSEKIVPIHLDFMFASVLSWLLSAIYIEKKLIKHYQSISKNGADIAKFPYASWYLTWCLSLTIISVYLLVIRKWG